MEHTRIQTNADGLFASISVLRFLFWLGEYQVRRGCVPPTWTRWLKELAFPRRTNYFPVLDKEVFLSPCSPERLCLFFVPPVIPRSHEMYLVP